MSSHLESVAQVWSKAAVCWARFEDKWQLWSRLSDTPKLRVDMRALALSRIFLGIALLVDWGEMWFRRNFWLYDDGVCPATRRQLGDNGLLTFNIFLAFESDSGVTLILLVTFVAIGCLFVGFKTRWATLALFVMSRSKQVRFNKCMLYGGDELETHLLFWSLFLPLSHSWSLDAWLERRQASLPREIHLQENGLPSSVNGVEKGRKGFSTPVSTRVFPRSHPPGPEAPGSCVGKTLQSPCAPLLGYILVAHMCLVYVDTGFWKNGKDWENGLAVEQALNLGPFANPKTPFAVIVRQFPIVCWLMTVSTLWLERCICLIIFLPSETARLAITGAWVGLHFGMHICLQTGSFHYLSAAAWMSGFPTMAMDKFEAMLPSCVQRIASEAHMRRQPLRGLGLVGHLAASGFVLVVFLQSCGWNCQALGQNICPVANHVNPDPTIKRVMQTAGLNNKWMMFAPNVTHSEWWIDVVGAVEVNKKIHRIPLWKDGLPVFTSKVRGLWDEGWPRPVEPAPAWETNRWRKIFEKEAWKERKGDWGKFICKQWKKKRGGQRLVGLWTVKSYRKVEVKVVYGELHFELMSYSWCDKNGEAVMKNLKKPDWLRKGVYGKALPWEARRTGAVETAEEWEYEPEFAPASGFLQLVLLLPTAAFFFWLGRHRHFMGLVPKGIMITGGTERPHDV